MAAAPRITSTCDILFISQKRNWMCTGVEFWIAKIATNKIGGVTGDVLGGTCLFVHGLILLILEVV